MAGSCSVQLSVWPLPFRFGPISRGRHDGTATCGRLNFVSAMLFRRTRCLICLLRNSRTQVDQHSSSSISKAAAGKFSKVSKGLFLFPLPLEAHMQHICSAGALKKLAAYPRAHIDILTRAKQRRSGPGCHFTATPSRLKYLVLVVFCSSSSGPPV